ncbi:MAG: HlyD family efflux transporter periplasmic adaptor subunit [Oscillochloris sp.]|nr:HlyD family efflux transporter periplasmic adaptor subunit [Oscillochloris sp.]
MHTSRSPLYAAAIALLGATLLSACDTVASAQPAVTPQPVMLIAPTAEPTAQPAAPVDEGYTQISGTGIVRAAQSVSLSFLPAGRVEQVLVSEGDHVTAGQLLATLDTRPFDALVVQAEADLAAAQAAQSALTESPNKSDVQVAEANIRAAQVQLSRARNRDAQGVSLATSGVQEAQGNLQATRDELSRQKTNAELRLQQASDLVRQSQAAYEQAKLEWEYVQETGRAPQLPDVDVDLDTKVPEVGKIPVDGDIEAGELSEAAKQAYYNRYVVAEAALSQSQSALHQAQVDYDTARQHEVTGIQNAEQGVSQAQATLNLAQVPTEQSEQAAAQAALDAAQAARNRLNPAPKSSQKAIAASNVTRAEAALTQARLSREYAELHAPFDGVITSVEISTGEVTGPIEQTSTDEKVPSLQSALSILDTSILRFEVPVDEVDIGHVEIGQEAQIVLDALPDTIFTGKVSYIASSAQQELNVHTYLVRIDMDAPQGARDGMSGQVYLKMKD